jgi:hypothetical protein
MPDNRVEILGQEYHYRLLTRRELRTALENSNDDALLFEEEVCRTCATGTPEDFPGFDHCLAGIPTTLCQRVMESSGYTEQVSSLEAEALEWAKTPQARMDTLIVFCFPKKDYDDLEDMDPRSYYRYAAGAQLVIGGVYGMDASVFLDPSKDGSRQGRPPQGAPREPPGYAID